jgi:hypothetical protein
MKIYDFKNKRLYESNAVYTLSVEEFDADGNSIDQNSFEDTYSTLEDALEDSYELMANCAAEEGYDEDDVEYVQNEDNVVFTTPDGKKWIFTAFVNNNESKVVECGDTDKSEDIDKSEDVDESENADNVDVENSSESVAERFSRLRKMFESEDDEDNGDDKSDDEEKSDEDSNDDENNDEEGSKDGDNKDDENSDDEDEEMKAVIITVKKGDEEKCKEEMINADIAEDDIEILDADEDAENVEIRIDVNSIMELKDYLSKKGIDLEEEIGGEIVDDSDDDSDKEDSDEENGDDENKEGDDEDFDFDNLGDLFGAEEDEE